MPFQGPQNRYHPPSTRHCNLLNCWIVGLPNCLASRLVCSPRKRFPRKLVLSNASQRYCRQDRKPRSFDSAVFLVSVLVWCWRWCWHVIICLAVWVSASLLGILGAGGTGLGAARSDDDPWGRHARCHLVLTRGSPPWPPCPCCPCCLVPVPTLSHGCFLILRSFLFGRASHRCAHPPPVMDVRSGISGTHIFSRARFMTPRPRVRRPFQCAGRRPPGSALHR